MNLYKMLFKTTAMKPEPRLPSGFRKITQNKELNVLAESFTAAVDRAIAMIGNVTEVKDGWGDNADLYQGEYTEILSIQFDRENVIS